MSEPTSGSKGPATFPSLPYETLELVLDYAVAGEPTHALDPSILPGACNPWFRIIRTKKALPLICRASFWPGMTVLYRDIVFRRMGQVPALAETLRAADIGPRLGTLIKSIRWDSCVVASPCADVVRQDLVFIFSQCTQLQSFCYRPHHNFPLRCQPSDRRDNCEGFFNPLWFIMMPFPLSDSLLLHPNISCDLRVLDIPLDPKTVDNDDLDYKNVILLAIDRVLSAFKRLESLSLGSLLTPFSSSVLEELMTMGEVSLPFLKNLRMVAPDLEDVDTYLCSRWNVPMLRHLTILIDTNWSPMRLLKRFGAQLRYLHLYPVRYTYPEVDVSAYLRTLSSTLYTMCPRLEHLIVPHSGPLMLDSPTLTHLDFWTADHGLKSPQQKSQADANRLFTVDPQSNVPSLRTVRFIFTPGRNPGGSLQVPSSKCATSDPDWPWICHPDLLPAEGRDQTLYHSFPLGQVAQTVAAIIPQDLWKECWEGDARASDRAVWYGDLGEMRRIMAEGRGEGTGGTSGELEQPEEARCDEPTSDSDWTSDDSDSEYVELDSDDDEQPEERDTVTNDRIEGSEEFRDVDARHEGTSGEQSQQVRQDGDGDTSSDEEASGDEELRAGAAAGLVSPEYPRPQLDRATVLAAFRRGRDRESYSHVIPWNQD